VRQLVLFLGNFVNEGTFRGGINGFKLSSLQKVCSPRSLARWFTTRPGLALTTLATQQMMDVRGVDGRTTLLHYLARIIRNEHMELLDFTDELSHCGDAARGTERHHRRRCVALCGV
jgi:hypothetical protein